MSPLIGPLARARQASRQQPKPEPPAPPKRKTKKAKPLPTDIGVAVQRLQAIEASQDRQAEESRRARLQETQPQNAKQAKKRRKARQEAERSRAKTRRDIVLIRQQAREFGRWAKANHIPKDVKIGSFHRGWSIYRTQTTYAIPTTDKDGGGSSYNYYLPQMFVVDANLNLYVTTYPSNRSSWSAPIRGSARPGSSYMQWELLSEANANSLVTTDPGKMANRIALRVMATGKPWK